MPLHSVPLTVITWVNYSEGKSIHFRFCHSTYLNLTAIVPQKRRQVGEYALREEVLSLVAQYEAKKQSGDKVALQTWATEKRDIRNARQAVSLGKFL